MSATHYPLSAQQARLHALGPRAAPDAFVCRLVARIEGVDGERLQQAAQGVVNDYEILRTRFVTPAQMTMPVQEVVARAALGDPNACALVLSIDKTGDGHIQIVLSAAAINADAASLRTLLAEIIERACGRDVLDADAPLQYADVGQWQAEILADGGDAEDAAALSRAGKAYWASVDASSPATPATFLTRRDGVQRFAPATVRATEVTDIDAALWRCLREQAAPDTTLKAVCLAAWQALLTRLSVETGAALGLVSDGRNVEELTDCVGPLSRVLPLACTSVPTESLFDNAARCAAAATEAQDWQDYLSPAVGDRALPGYFPIGFACERRDPGSYASVSAQITSCTGHADRFELELRLIECQQSGTCELVLGFDDARIDRAAATRLMAQLVTLLREAVQQPDKAVAQLGILPAAQQHQVVQAFNATTIALDTPLTHIAFERQVLASPDAVAVSATLDGGQGSTLTYAELNTHANQLAHGLLARGIGGGQRVALHLARGPSLLVAMLACLKVGAAYVPLDPDYDSPRLQRVLDEADVQLRLAETTNADSLHFTGATVLLDTQSRHLAAMPIDNPELDVSNDAIAYIIYTSGSTGQPKGVPVSQANLAHANAARVNYYDGPATRFALLSSHAFDSSVVGLYWPLLTGGTLCLLPSETRGDAAAIASTIAAQSITHMLCLPSLYAHVLEAGTRHSLASLATVIVAGEPCPAWLTRQHAANLIGAHLYNEYGPTEGTVWCSVHRCTGEETGAVVSIGRPIANTSLYVLDEHYQPLPVGAAGELWLAGPGVVASYLGGSFGEAGNERFAPNPFDPPKRMYRTGDRARWAEDGSLDFLGRVDEQVKIRGYRVEPAEIEAVLAASTQVLEAVVVARTGSPRDSDDDDPHALAEALSGLATATAEELLANVECANDERAIPRFHSAPAAGTGSA